MAWCVDFGPGMEVVVDESLNLSMEKLMVGVDVDAPGRNIDFIKTLAESLYKGGIFEIIGIDVDVPLRSRGKGGLGQ